MCSTRLEDELKSKEESILHGLRAKLQAKRKQQHSTQLNGVSKFRGATEDEEDENAEEYRKMEEKIAAMRRLHQVCCT